MGDARRRHRSGINRRPDTATAATSKATAAMARIEWDASQTENRPSELSGSLKTIRYLCKADSESASIEMGILARKEALSPSTPHRYLRLRSPGRAFHHCHSLPPPLHRPRHPAVGEERNRQLAGPPGFLFPRS